MNWPWGQRGSHPEASFWGSKGSMPLYAAMEMYSAQARVILPSLYAPFGLAQPNVTVVSKEILIPPQGVRGWPAGESLVARAWRQAAPSGYCGHVIVASGAMQSPQKFTLRLGGSFPANQSWSSMRAVRLFAADYAVLVSANGTFSDYVDAVNHNIYQIGDCGDLEPPPPPPVCQPDAAPLGCYDVSAAGCSNNTKHKTGAGWRHDPSHGCLMMAKSSVGDLSKELTKTRCAAACQHWTPEAKDKPRAYDVAGVLDGTACFCGMAAQLGQNASLKRPAAECEATPCSGDNTSMCGGVNRLLVYNYTVTAQAGPWDPH